MAKLTGAAGNETILGNAADDEIYGLAGNDSLDGLAGNDTIFGGDGLDTIGGGDGSDIIDGGAGDDTVGGGDGSDIIDGGAGDDTVGGGGGNDIVDGGAGNDLVDGGYGDDSITGGLGNDTFFEFEGQGDDTITDFNTGTTGTFSDGILGNKDLIDLSFFYDESAIQDVNNTSTDPFNTFGNALALLRADAADGKLDGMVNSEDFSSIIGDIDLTLLDGSGRFVKGDDLTFENTNVACFTSGTLIKTINGERPIEDLVAGDRVLTMDNGYLTIQWIGGTPVSRERLLSNPQLKPIRIKAGALGENIPAKDLLVSPQHRILVRSLIAVKMFNTNEVLIPANKLLVIDGIDIAEDVDIVEYHHILFNAHEIIFSNGAPTESLFTGPEALKSMSPAARKEIAALFSEILKPDFEYISARFIPEKGKQMKKFVQRHKQNQHPLVVRV